MLKRKAKNVVGVWHIVKPSTIWAWKTSRKVGYGMFNFPGLGVPIGCSCSLFSSGRPISAIAAVIVWVFVGIVLLSVAGILEGRIFSIKTCMTECISSGHDGLCYKRQTISFKKA